MRTTVITKSLSKTAVDFYRPSAVSFIDLFFVLQPNFAPSDISTSSFVQMSEMKLFSLTWLNIWIGKQASEDIFWF